MKNMDEKKLAQKGRVERFQTETEEDGESASTYRVFLAPEGVETVDGRIFDEGAISFRSERMPFMATDKTTWGHEDAVLVGNLINATFEEVDGVRWAVGEIDWDTDDEATEFKRLVDEDRMRTVSVDPGKVEFEIEVTERDEDGWPIAWTVHFTEYEIGGVTLVPFQAFDDARIEPVTASAIPEVPPAKWFEDPMFTPEDGRMSRQPDGGWACPLTITPDGRVFGHLARWEQNHITFGDDARVTAPRSKSGYAYFMTGEIDTTDGVRRVGTLTMDTTHASQRANATSTIEHYENTGRVWAFVTVGEDKHGVWFSGVLSRDLSAQEMRLVRASTLSGDWRRIGGGLELVAALSVNTPGFPIARVASGAKDELQELALVAAGIVDHRLPIDAKLRTDNLFLSDNGKLDRLIESVESLVTELRRPAIAASAAKVLADLD